MKIALRGRYIFLGLAVVFCLTSVAGYWRWTGQLPGFLLESLLGHIKLPPGFTIQLYASHVPNARSMTLGARGTLFVGSRWAGKIYALVDHNHNNLADEVITIARGLNTPNGVTFRNGALYVAEVNRVLRFDDIEAQLKNPPAPVGAERRFPER